MRVLLYTGKGGVGKTSLAAATALAAAEHGHRVFLLSTDSADNDQHPAHVPLHCDRTKSSHIFRPFGLRNLMRRSCC